MSTEKPNRYWPSITSRADATNVMEYGGGLAVFQSILTAAIALYAIYRHSQFLGIDAYSLLDVVLLAVIAWRLFRFSFWWAIAAVMYALVNIVVRFTQGGVKTPIVGIIFLLVYVNAMRGGYYLRKHPAQPEPQLTV